MAYKKKGNESIKYRAPGIVIYLKPVGVKKWWQYRYRYLDNFGIAHEIRRSSKTSELSVAKHRAYQNFQAKLGLAKSGPFDAPRGLPTCHEIIECYRENIGKEDGARLKPATVKENANAFMNFCKLALGDPKSVRVNQLTPQSVRKWREARYAKRNLEFGKDEDLRLNYSLNSTWQNIKSVFSLAALRLYQRELGNTLDVDDWKSVKRLRQMNTQYEPLPPGVVAAMDRDREELLPEQRVIYELARYCALTKSEILAVRWHWIIETPEGLKLEIKDRPANPKEGIDAWTSKLNAKNGKIALDPRMVASWRELVPCSNPFGHIIPAAHSTERERIVRKLNQWLGVYIKDRNKKLHELRKHAGSEVLMRNRNPYEAAKFIRDTLETTLKHYASLLEDVAALSPYEQKVLPFRKAE